MIETFRAPVEYQFLGYRTIDNGYGPVMQLYTSEPDQVIENANDDTLLDLLSFAPTYDHESIDLTIGVLAASNQVARVSRRGVGNVLLMNKSLVGSVDIERFNKSRYGFQLVESDLLPNDEIFVMYIGTGTTFKAVDAPFAFDGSNLRVHKDWLKYCQRVLV